MTIEHYNRLLAKYNGDRERIARLFPLCVKELAEKHPEITQASNKDGHQCRPTTKLTKGK